jgi:hypothetical protein
VQAINLIYDEIGDQGASNQVCAFTKIGNQYYIISVQQYDKIHIGTFVGDWAKGGSKSVTRFAGGHPSSINNVDIVQNLFADVKAGACIYVKIGLIFYLIAAVCDEEE